MIRTLAIVAVLTLTAAGCSSGDAADTTSTVPPLGEPTAGEQPLWLYSFTAGTATATIDGDSVTIELTDTSRSATAFTDRPERAARQVTTPGLIAQWDSLFAGDPPNASVTGRTVDDEQRTWVVEIDTASATANGTVRLRGALIEGTGTDALRDAAVFVDDVVAPPCTPHIPLWDDPAFGLQLFLFAERLDVTATSTADTITLAVPILDGDTDVQIGDLQVSAARGGNSVDLPAARVPSFEAVDGAQQAIVAPIDSWSGDDATGPATLQVSATITVGEGVYSDCSVTLTVPAGS